MEQFAIGANFKSAAARRNERKRFDAFAEFKNFGRQTDGLRRVVSNYTIFDRDFRFHRARSFPMKMVRKSRDRVKVRAALAFSRSRRWRASATTALFLPIASGSWGFSAFFFRRDRSAAKVIGEDNEQLHHRRFVVHAE
jgi:hypothetical protein